MNVLPLSPINLINNIGFNSCNQSTFDTEKCVSELSTANCTNMDKMAQNLITNFNNKKINQDSFTKDWNESFSNTSNDAKKHREELGRIFGSINKNLICFTNSVNSKLPNNATKLNVPDNSFQKGILEGSQSINKLLVSILIFILVCLVILSGTFLSKTFSMMATVLLFFITVIIIHMI